MRILIVTHAPLSMEFGAGQMALNLANTFRELGHEVMVWSSHPVPPTIKWWRSIGNVRARLDMFLEQHEPFDLIDIHLGPGMITKRVTKSARIVVGRSVQPPILYLMQDILLPNEFTIGEVRKWVSHVAHLGYYMWPILQDWSRADRILCLGSVELRWMQRWFPFWRHKLSYYVNALAHNEQATLTEIRLNRKQSAQAGIRFLWIGRWAAHKGISELMSFIAGWSVLHPQDTFTIAGCGDIAVKDPRLEKIACDNIRIVPKFDRTQLRDLLENHDVGLFTSRVEGWGLSLHEMLESGMHVYATEAGGVADLKQYLPTMLHSFPPTEPISARDLSNADDFTEYYNIFRWPRIGIRYLSWIFGAKENNDLQSST